MENLRTDIVLRRVIVVTDAQVELFKNLSFLYIGIGR